MRNNKYISSQHQFANVFIIHCIWGFSKFHILHHSYLFASQTVLPRETCIAYAAYYIFMRLNIYGSNVGRGSGTSAPVSVGEKSLQLFAEKTKALTPVPPRRVALPSFLQTTIALHLQLSNKEPGPL